MTCILRKKGSGIKPGTVHLEPESVSVALPAATIKTARDLDRYVDELRSRVQPHLADGNTVLL